MAQRKRYTKQFKEEALRPDIRYYDNRDCPLPTPELTLKNEGSDGSDATRG